MSVTTNPNTYKGEPVVSGKYRLVIDVEAFQIVDTDSNENEQVDLDKLAWVIRDAIEYRAGYTAEAEPGDILLVNVRDQEKERRPYACHDHPIGVHIDPLAHPVSISDEELASYCDSRYAEISG